MKRDVEKKIRQWERSWERKGYRDGLPDEAPQTLEGNGRVPSWRMVCIAVMKTDETLSTLGFQRPACEAYNDLKRIEIAARGGKVRSIQLRLF